MYPILLHESEPRVLLSPTIAWSTCAWSKYTRSLPPFSPPLPPSPPHFSQTLLSLPQHIQPRSDQAAAPSALQRHRPPPRRGAQDEPGVRRRGYAPRLRAPLLQRRQEERPRAGAPRDVRVHKRRPAPAEPAVLLYVCVHASHCVWPCARLCHTAVNGWRLLVVGFMIMAAVVVIRAHPMASALPRGCPWAQGIC